MLCDAAAGPPDQTKHGTPEDRHEFRILFGGSDFGSPGVFGRLYYTLSMSYVTLGVEIDHGRVVAKEPSRLPDKGSGLLTILESGENAQSRLTPVQALDALQKHLAVDAQKAVEWMGAVRDARR